MRIAIVLRMHISKVMCIMRWTGFLKYLDKQAFKTHFFHF